MENGTSQLLEDLTAARELISVPERWTQESNARAADKHSVPSMSADAACWCSVGALVRVTGGIFGSARLKAAIESFSPVVDVVKFNDTHTHAEVLALFDKAIAAEREKEGA